MYLEPEQLHNNPRYTLLLTLAHDQIIPFVQAQLKKRNIVSGFYWVANLAFLVLLLVTALIQIEEKKIVVADAVFGAFLGIGLAMTAIIWLHECIHYAVYKLQGAKQASIQAKWKQMVFLALADRHIANRNEFFWLAIAPFLTITLLVGTVAFWASGFGLFVCLGILLMHTGACSGDFALISLLYEHRDKPDIVTYDDVPNQLSYFFIVETEEKTA